MIHQRELIIGMGIPGAVDLERTGGLAGRRVAQVEGDAAVFVAELLDGVEGRIVAGDARMFEFNPPPAISSSGKPEPASS